LKKPIDRTLDGVLKKLSKSTFEEGLYQSRQSIEWATFCSQCVFFLGLASLIDRAGSRNELTPEQSIIVVFSYGSGALALPHVSTLFV
jgi:hydroxymethylglutaryl-CoA synthase